MAKRKSSGVLLYRNGEKELEVLLVLPGGPFWVNKDAGAWSIPKGEFDDTETPLQAAIREFQEETGTRLQGDFLELRPIVQKAGKQVYAFAQQGELDAAAIICNTFKMEWPPKSGKWQSFPEVAKAQWFPITRAKEQINPAQAAFLDELLQKLDM